MTETISKTEFAKLIGVSQSRVSQLIVAGLPTSADGKRIDRKAALAFVSDNVDRSRIAVASDDAEKLVAARTRAATALAAQREFDLRLKKGGYVDKLATLAAMRAHRRQVSDILMELPEFCAQHLAECFGVTLEDARDAVQDLADCILVRMFTVAPPPTLDELLDVAKLPLPGEYDRRIIHENYCIDREEEADDGAEHA